MDCVESLPGGGFSRRLPSNDRLHLQHGPIDLLIQAHSANPQEVTTAYTAATSAFTGLLAKLALDLDQLRQPAAVELKLMHPVSRNMSATAMRFSPTFVTPMICVAGAVADYIKHHMLLSANLDKVLVNNGGDISVHLSPGSTAKLAICGDVRSGRCTDFIELSYEDKVGGVATSGWPGRSHSLGIADAVTVLADTAALADAAATLVANAVDLPGHRNIRREPATELSPDTDLGDRRVTTHVGELTDSEIDAALSKGMPWAKEFVSQRLIHSGYLHLQGKTQVCQPKRGSSFLVTDDPCLDLSMPNYPNSSSSISNPIPAGG